MAHMEHVSTQMVYAISVAAASFIGYLASGFAGGNVYVTLIAGVAALAVILVVIRLIGRHAKPKAMGSAS